MVVTILNINPDTHSGATGPMNASSCSLISPINSAEEECLQLKLNLNESGPSAYFICEDRGYSRTNSAFC